MNLFDNTFEYIERERYDDGYRRCMQGCPACKPHPKYKDYRYCYIDGTIGLDHGMGCSPSTLINNERLKCLPEETQKQIKDRYNAIFNREK